jgi:hypothetical protein
MIPIETHYAGYRFRSRTEARWAVFFDELGVRYQYEPEAYFLGDGVGSYLPDFFITMNPEQSGAGCWVEIKGQKPTDTELRKLFALQQATKHTALLFVGPPGFDADPYEYDSVYGYGWVRPHHEDFEPYESLALTFKRFSPVLDMDRAARALRRSRAERFGT